MASFARKVASPRNLAGAFISPKVGTPRGVTLHHSPCELLNPQVFSSSKKTTESPLVARVSPCSQSRSVAVQPGPSTRGRSVRKLPWSDGGNSSAVVQPIVNPLGTPLALDGVLCVRSGSHSRPSADTPNRAEMLKNFRQRSRSFDILGKGSFGVVVEATYRGKIVAVKIVLPGVEASKQMINETNSLELCHPNIVSVMKVIMPSNNIPGIILMERVRGFSLQSLLNHGALQNRFCQKLKYSIDICSALVFCHKKGVLHGDVKPQNVLVEVFRDTCKLCDFGCSLKIGANNSPLQFQGSVPYAAPEVLQGAQFSTASDVYSFGITLWQLISMEKPYEDMNVHTVIYKVVSSEFRPKLPQVLSPDEEEFLSLVQRCWSQSAPCRPSMEEVFEELVTQYQNLQL